jgi:hypothetical protein
MTVQVAIQDRFAQMLAPLGDLRQAVDTALRRYAIEQIATKLTELRRRDQEFAAKYGCDYATFKSKTACDEQFVVDVERNISKTWELDLAEWQFCHEGAQDWSQRLQEILLE